MPADATERLSANSQPPHNSSERSHQPPWLPRKSQEAPSQGVALTRPSPGQPGLQVLSSRDEQDLDVRDYAVRRDVAPSRSVLWRGRGYRLQRGEAIGQQELEDVP